MSYVSILFLTALLIILATGIIMLVLIYQKKQVQYISEKAQMKAVFDKEILESKLEIQEQTMRNISQEVHDNIGQVLSVVKLNINLMDCNGPAHILQSKIKDTSDLVGNVIRDLRNLSKSLDGNHIANIGLVKAITLEFEMLKKTGVYLTTLTVDGEPYALPEQKELILFRIFQETINNIIKHAQASSVEVRIHFLPQLFLLHIRDNGLGFDTATTGTNTGLGLRNIVNRSHLIGAACTINSAAGKGTSVNIKLPVATPEFVAMETSIL